MLIPTQLSTNVLPYPRYLEQLLAADPSLAQYMFPLAACALSGEVTTVRSAAIEVEHAEKPITPGPLTRVMLEQWAVEYALPTRALSTEVLGAEVLSGSAQATAASSFSSAHFSSSIAGSNSERDADLLHTLKEGLRKIKQRAFVLVCSRDLYGDAGLREVVESMTELAQFSLEIALFFLQPMQEALYGMPRNEAGEAQPFVVIGMGKLGGRELNVSSDIDLIFLYPEDGTTDANGADGARAISNFEYHTRLARLLMNVISDITPSGQVFRVDMRLRPNGDSGPLVCSFEMLEQYFVSQGRAWERYAWIKARMLASTAESVARTKLEEALEAMRRPFVFRRYLDFGAIESLRDLHGQIQREVKRKDRAVDVKLGPGGIREIEFIAQVFQIIRGGRDRSLVIRPTLAVLELLCVRNQITATTQQELTEAYVFLRRLEHRLQYLDNAQTHILPDSSSDQSWIAQAMNFPSWENFLQELERHRSHVTRNFDLIFSTENRVVGEPAEQQSMTAQALALLLHQCAQNGNAPVLIDDDDSAFSEECDALTRRISEFEKGIRYAQLSATARSHYHALLPRMVVAAYAADNANTEHAVTKKSAGYTTLHRLLDLIEAVAKRPAYLALLVEYPQALNRLTKILSASSWGATYLIGHPLLLDELLDARLLETKPDFARLQIELQNAISECDTDVERQMDLMREAHHAQVFRLLMQDVEGLWQLEELSDQLSALADLVLAVSLHCCWQQFPQRHVANPHFAIIGYGKLGGKELGYASDLDLVFVYDDMENESAKIYSRLALRINSWLSSRTAAGQLYETDLRLRPNGDSGLIVTSLDAFAQYQQSAAWLWEHQALTRARFCAGDSEMGQRFEDIRCAILAKPRVRDTLLAEVLAMRLKMRNAQSSHEQFDLKHDAGGLIDVEFIVQTLVLGHSFHHPELLANKGNIALLGIAAAAGLIPLKMAQSVMSAYRELRRCQHALRLNNAKNIVAVESVAEHRQAVLELWRYVFPNDTRQ